jgi:hypothetical protein
MVNLKKVIFAVYFFIICFSIKAQTGINPYKYLYIKRGAIREIIYIRLIFNKLIKIPVALQGTVALFISAIRTERDFH